MEDMDIDQKTTGTLIDELITTSMKCWHAQETVCNESAESKVAEAAIKAQLLNARRNALIRAIDSRLGESNASPTPKTYG